MLGMELTFVAFLLLFVIVGVSSIRLSRKTTVDYLLAEHNIKPWLAALSAVATNNSGYMFIGLIGYTYAVGLQSIWLMIGWIWGDFLASITIHKKLRQKTQERKAHTYAGVLATWQGEEFKVYRLIAGIVSLIFLGSYAAAQFTAAAKALHVILEWPLTSGAVIGALIVVLYCFAGGIRASIWTDAAQSIVMIVAMFALLYVGLHQAGGVASAMESWGRVEGFMDWFPRDMAGGAIGGPILFILGWVFAGFGVAAQPHIMIRFMALDDPEKMGRTRGYYYSWFILFWGAATGVGMLAKILLPQAAGFDAELALPMMAQQLLPGPFVGLILAGIFAATISTADSLILSCSASFTNDIFRKKKFDYNINKLATLGTAAVALGITLTGNQSVFDLVMVSWAALSAAFLPLLFVYIRQHPLSEASAILLSATSLSIMLLWRHLGYHNTVYEIFPAVVGSLIIYYLVIRPLIRPLGQK